MKSNIQKQNLKLYNNQMRSGPVYTVKPKYIFKHPFNKYDLANPSNRQTQNQELTDYFNYGFNEDTMNIYGKLVKRFIQVLDHHKNLQYFNEPSQLMRLNDQIPMDFGGFGKFHDPWIVDNQTAENFHDGQTLMKYFVMMIYANASRKVQYPLIQYVKNMYVKEGQESDLDNSLYGIIQQIGKNLQQKYQETMKKLQEKANQAKNPPKKQIHKQGHQAPLKEHPRQHSQKELEAQHQHVQEKKAEKPKEKSPKKEKKSKKQSSEDDDSDDSSSQSDSSSEVKGKREKDDHSKSKKKDQRKMKKRSKDKQRKKKDKKDKNKSKKVKKEKSYKRSKSRDRKKKHH